VNIEISAEKTVTTANWQPALPNDNIIMINDVHSTNHTLVQLKYAPIVYYDKLKNSKIKYPTSKLCHRN